MKKTGLVLLTAIFCLLMSKPADALSMNPFKREGRTRAHTLMITGNYLDSRLLVELAQHRTKQPILLLSPDGFENYQWDERQMTTGLYILDGSLSIVGRVEDLSPDERIYSARFDGDIAYFCTYRQTDPLFAVDVSDPTDGPQRAEDQRLLALSARLGRRPALRLRKRDERGDRLERGTEARHVRHCGQGRRLR